MGQLPERGGEGRAEGGAADPARVWPRQRGALLSSSGGSSPPPLGPGSRGAGSRLVVGLAQGRGLPRCIPATFAFGGREACSETEFPRDPAPEGAGGVGTQVSSEHSAALECFFFFFLSRAPFPRPWRPPVGPQPRSSPASSPLATGQPPSLAAGGDGWRRRPKVKGGEPAGLGPLCELGSAPPPPALPSPTPRRAPALVTFPGVENCISGPLKTPASGPILKISAGGAGLLPGAAFLPGRLFWVLGAPGDPLFAPPREL